MQKLVNLKQNYLKEIDYQSKYIVKRLISGKLVTTNILNFIIELYNTEQETKIFEIKDKFIYSGHQAITSDFEFFISRILYHYSKEAGKDWEISLRKSIQDKKTKKQVQPDILIRKKGKIIAILEIKVKAGYMQCFFSKIREKKDIDKGYNTKELINKIKSQLKKYSKLENCGKDKVFVLLPTFALVSRKTNSEEIFDFKMQFEKNSGLEKSNLIILSNNKDLDLSNPKEERLDPSNDFERFIKKISVKNRR